MRYFREQGKSDHEVIEALNAKFGDNYQIMTRKTVKLGGILGVGRRNGVEYFGYIKEKNRTVSGRLRDRLDGVSKKEAPNSNDSFNASMDFLPGNPEPQIDSPNHSGSNYRNKNSGKIRGKGRKKGKESSENWGKEYYPISEQEQAERDERNRTDILARFAKNKEVQRVLRDKGLISEPDPEFGSRQNRSRPGEPPSPPQFWETGGMLRYDIGQNGDAVYNSGSPGFTPIHDPSQRRAERFHDPEYASVNYDVLSTQKDEHRREATPYSNVPYIEATQLPPAYRGQTEAHQRQPQLSGTESADFLRRLESVERKLERRGNTAEPGSLLRLRENMYNNEFPPLFVDRMVAQMKRELPLEELEKLEVLWEYVLLHVAQNMRFVDVQQQNHSRIMVLIGPTGVGKTTTIAKLAARQCVEAIGGSRKVHLITLDNYRIGAQDQIRTYGEILGARVDCVETTEGLASCIAQDNESDVILIDTMGRSPGDHVKLAELRRFLDYSGNCEIHLTMSATSGAGALREIITQFKPFGFRSVILTKLDELGRIGGTMAAFLQEDIPLSYVTTGQKVPQDIRPASPLVLFRQLVDIQLDWQSFTQKLEESIF